MMEEKDINYDPVTALLQVGSAVCNVDIPELGVSWSTLRSPAVPFMTRGGGHVWANDLAVHTHI